MSVVSYRCAAFGLACLLVTPASAQLLTRKDLSAAIAAFLVKGLPMEEAIAEAKSYLQGAIAQAESLHIGSGAVPLWHFYRQMPPG